MIKTKPQTYWEARANVTEEALQRLANIICNANPMLLPALQHWNDAWGKIIDELGQEPAMTKEAKP